MKIKYENKNSDIEAYGQLLYAKSPTVKQHRKKAWLTAVVLIVIFGIVLYVFNEDTNIQIFWLVLSVAWLIYIPFQHKKKYLKNMIETYQDENHKNFFGFHELTVSDSGLTDEIGIVVNHTGWDKIEHIEETDSHAFIFINSAMAHAISKENILDGDFEKFLSTLKSKLKESKKTGDKDENRSAK